MKELRETLTLDRIAEIRASVVTTMESRIVTYWPNETMIALCDLAALGKRTEESTVAEVVEARDHYALCDGTHTIDVDAAKKWCRAIDNLLGKRVRLVAEE